MRPKRFHQMAEVMEERDALRESLMALLIGIEGEMHNSYSEQSLEDRLVDLGLDGDTAGRLVALWQGTAL